jgi:Ca-activated chloride channel homolog
MILLTDGIPSPGDYREIAQRMADKGITLSTVSLGYEAEQDLLIEMSRIAGGRHHHCDDPKDVPGVMVRETRAATADDTPQSFATSVYRALPGLQIAGAPQLAGYVLTNPKPEAEQLLMAAGRDPLLAWWSHGSGIAVALTCDAGGSVNRAWQQSPGYADFWQRLVRHAARRPAPPPLDLSLVRQGDTAFVRLDLDPVQLAATDPATVRITLTVPEGDARELPLIPVVAGRYEASFPAVGPGEYRVEATIDRSAAPPLTASGSLFVDYPDELRLQANDVALLQAIAETTGGRFDPAPESVLAPDDRTVERRHSPWRYLVLAALLLIVADLAIRRIRF